MTPQRPYYLDLRQIKLPIGGWVSILHRASGAAMALAVPLVLYAWMRSLETEDGFQAVAGFLGGGFGWVIAYGLLWALLHHFFAGLRHLGFDLGWGEEKETARMTAWAALLAGAGLAVVFALGSLL